MKNDCFFRAIAAGTACLTLSAGDADYKLYNVVPMYIGHEAEQAAKCVEMYDRTGDFLELEIPVGFYEAAVVRTF